MSLQKQSVTPPPGKLFCALSWENVYEPFLSVERTVT